MVFSGQHLLKTDIFTGCGLFLRAAQIGPLVLRGKERRSLLIREQKTEALWVLFDHPLLDPESQSGPTNPWFSVRNSLINECVFHKITTKNTIIKHNADTSMLGGSYRNGALYCRLLFGRQLSHEQSWGLGVTPRRYRSLHQELWCDSTL